MKSQPRKISINLLDQSFEIFTDASDEKVGRIQAILQDSLESVIERTKSPLNVKTMLLVALNITESLVDLQQSHDLLKGEVTQRSQKVLKLLENIQPSNFNDSN